MKKSNLVAAAAGLAVLFSLSGCADAPAESPEISADVQRSVSAHFNVHGLEGQTLEAGYTIPWVRQGDRSSVWGHAVATGQTGQQGCNIFKVNALYGGGDSVVRTNSTMEICP